MEKKLAAKTILENWKLALAIVSGTIALCVTVWGFSAKYTKKQIHETNIEVKVDTLSNQFNAYVLKKDDFQQSILDSLSKISGQVKVLSGQVQRQQNAQNNLREYMIENAPTKGDILRILEVFNDEKKNDNRMIVSK